MFYIISAIIFSMSSKREIRPGGRERTQSATVNTSGTPRPGSGHRRQSRSGGETRLFLPPFTDQAWGHTPVTGRIRTNPRFSAICHH